MRNIWYSLAWKEWHEHKWKLASIVAIMWSVTAPILVRSETDQLGMATAMLMLCVVLLSVFVGLAAAANERSRGTVTFLQALPVPIWRVGLLKVVFGLMTVLVPIGLTFAFFYACNEFFDLEEVDRRDWPMFRLESWYLSQFALYGMIGGSLFLWSAAAGVNRRDEVTAGAVALSIIVAWITLLVVLVEKTSILGGSPFLEVIALSTAPIGPALADMFLPSEWKRSYLEVALAVATVTHVALAAWYLIRFGRIKNADVRSPQHATRQAGRADWLAPPRRTWFSAIAWKQFRESGPIALAGVAGIVGIVALFVLPEIETYNIHSFAHVLAGVTISLGFAVSLVVGIGVFLSDLTPQLNTFWRSRPIQPSAWFWTKLISGVTVLLLFFSLPLLVMGVIYWKEVTNELPDNSPLLVVLIPLSIYTAAVATTCLVRHAVYAAILSIPLMYSGIAMIGIWYVASALVGLRTFPRHAFAGLTPNENIAGLTLSLVISTLLAWLAVRNDWGWKSRY